MKRFIVKKQQLVEYLEAKKAEKIFYDIIYDLHNNAKFLNENISQKKVNQSIIDNYNRKNLITPKVFEMLTQYGIINSKREII